MCPNWNSFTVYEIVSNGVVVMGNNSPYKIVGIIRRVRLMIFDETIKTLNEVRHVLDLKRNLIS